MRGFILSTLNATLRDLIQGIAVCDNIESPIDFLSILGTTLVLIPCLAWLLTTARANSDGALPVHYGGIRRTPNSFTKFYQGNGVEERQQSALSRAVDAYLGDNSFVNTITEFADDPVDFVEDALESVGSTIKGWFS